LLKASTDEDEDAIHKAPICDSANEEGNSKDLTTGETLVPLQHEGLAPNPALDPATEV
jgi:hypothetical protein